MHTYDDPTNNWLQKSFKCLGNKIQSASNHIMVNVVQHLLGDLNQARNKAEVRHKQLVIC